MKNDKEKEIKYLIYLKNEIIRNEKKELKRLRNELFQLEQSKKIKRKGIK